MDRIAEESDVGQAIQDFCKLTKSAVEAFSIHPRPMKTFYLILVNLAAAIDVLSEFTLHDLFAHLPHDSTDYTEFSRLSAELYRQQVGLELDINSVSLLRLIEDAIVPFLRKDALVDKMSAVKLVLIMKKHVTNIGNGKGRRKSTVLQKFRAAAARPLKDNGNDVGPSSSQVDYFDCRHHRSGAMVVFFVLLLANEIETKSGAGGGFGFGRRVLDLTWSDLTRRCNKFLVEEFFDTTSVDAFGQVCEENDFKFLKKIGDEEKEKKTKVVIFNRQQINCLQTLLQFDFE